MSEVTKIATRVSYGNALVELAKEHDDVYVLDADLAAATQTAIFKKEFPERHIDCGIAECNMIGIAAGLAATGKVPFASSFAMFAAGRAFEQVRNSVGYPHLNVKIGATHAGISVGEDGATHQCNEDIALMRTIPGMVILNPSDDIEAKAAVKAAYEHEGPVYMRFGRLAVPIINDRPDYKFEIGKGVTLREGKDVAIIATGLCVSESLAAAEKLAADGIDAKVINIHTIKPLDEDLVVAAAKECGKVVTVEEHSVIGGLGSAVCETLSRKAPTPVKNIGVQDCFGESGPAYEHEGPVYMRFGRLAVPIINDRPDYKFEIGKGVTLREGKDVAIIATGLCVSESLAAAEKLAADGIDAKVINIHTIKPLDEDLVVAAAKECGKVVTVEEHSVIGGLGSAVCETLSRKAPTPVKNIGVQDCFGESGPAVALLEKYGLNAEGIYASVKEFV